MWVKAFLIRRTADRNAVSAARSRNSSWFERADSKCWRATLGQAENPFEHPVFSKPNRLDHQPTPVSRLFVDKPGPETDMRDLV
jgi:hypothetical protein